jgi:NUMOD4 motif/HNH endonuclease
MDKEIWRDIPGYIGVYQVSNFGEVRRLMRRPEFDILSGVRIERRVLRQSPGSHDRPQVILSMYHQTRTFNTYTLVLLAFKGACPVGMECCHNDGNCWNNKLGNLRWGTKKSNAEDKIIHGTQPRGAIVPMSRLTEKDVLEIRASSLSNNKAAVEFGVSEKTVRLIRNRVTWTHI